MQKVYFIPNIQHIFLSLKGCKELRLVPQNFPFGTVDDNVADTHEEQEDPSLEGGQPGINKQLVSSVDHVDVKAGEISESSIINVNASEKRFPKAEHTKQLTEKEPLIEPEEMPFPDTEEHISQLEECLRNTFKDVFDIEQDHLPVMSEKPLHIHISENAVPHVNYLPIPIPMHWKDAVYQLLQRYVAQGIIEEIPVGEAP